MTALQKVVVFGSIAGTFVGGAILLKDVLSGKIYEGKERIDDKVVIITGANSGIGKETARELAKRGGKIYMACRDLTRCEEARKEIVLETKNKHVYCRQCDLGSQKSIIDFAKAFKREQEHLHILVNNAGVMKCPRMITEEGIELQLGVNHMGHFLLTNLLLDNLKESAPSRIANVSSVAHERGFVKWDDLNSEKNYEPRQAYNQSKLANVMFTQELAKRLEGTGVTANSLHPGLVDTNIIRHFKFAQSSVSGAVFRFSAWPFVRSPPRGAQTVLYACLDPEFEKSTGKYLDDCAVVTPAMAARNPEDNLRLWLTSEKWTHLQAALQEVNGSTKSAT